MNPLDPITRVRTDDMGSEPARHCYSGMTDDREVNPLDTVTRVRLTIREVNSLDTVTQVRLTIG